MSEVPTFPYASVVPCTCISFISLFKLNETYHFAFMLSPKRIKVEVRNFVLFIIASWILPFCEWMCVNRWISKKHTENVEIDFQWLKMLWTLPYTSIFQVKTSCSSDIPRKYSETIAFSRHIDIEPFGFHGFPLFIQWVFLYF